MARPGTVIGWKLPLNQRSALLERFPPRYEKLIADHVTLQFGAAISAKVRLHSVYAR